MARFELNIYGVDDEILKTYATDNHLNTYGRYNPQLDGFTINPAWKLDATEENKELILNEIERRATRWQLR